MYSMYAENQTHTVYWDGALSQKKKKKYKKRSKLQKETKK
jgi:hypothetical protein